MPRNEDESTLLNLRAATGPMSREKIEVDARRGITVCSGDVISDGLFWHATIFVSDGLDVSGFASSSSACRSELDGLGLSLIHISEPTRPY